jgi:2-oxoisovalerate dehydrogenase E1 component alpha subunit
MKVERFMPHTTDDDDRRYRPAEEVAKLRQRDPVVTLAAYLIAQDFLTREQVGEIDAVAKRAVNQATDAADAAPLPDPSTLLDNLFVDQVEPGER